MFERFKLTPATHLFLIKGDQIFLLRRYNTGWSDGQYSVVGGHIDGNETGTQATIREAKEEAGIIISPEDIKFVQVVHRMAANERMDLFFVATNWDGEPKNNEPDKCDEIGWYPLVDLPKNTAPYIRFAIDNYRKGIMYSEFGWENK